MPARRLPTSERQAAALVAVVAGIGFVVAAWRLVPWEPVPGGLPDAVPASSAFDAGEIALGEHYALWSRIWSWSSLAVQLVVIACLGLTRLRERLLARLRGPWWVQVVVTVVVVTLVLRVLALPFGIALQQHRLVHGLSTQSWWGWARDVGTGDLVSITVTGLGLVVLIGLARRWARAWVAVAAAGAGALVVLGSLAYPVVVEPLYNSFTPLPDGPLQAAIRDAADSEGVPVDDVMVADASRRTTTLNAYVSGFSGTRRVVLYDTLVESLPEDQALSVVAHELGHARHNDVLAGTLLGALGSAFAIGLLGLLGRDRLRDAAAVPLVMALLALGTQVASPVQNGISRRVETRADVDALAATRDPGAFAAMQIALARRSLADPTPPALSQWWWGTHPTVLQRLAIARSDPDR